MKRKKRNWNENNMEETEANKIVTEEKVKETRQENENSTLRNCGIRAVNVFSFNI